MRVVVLGAGSWGTALTILLARNGHDVVLAGRDSEELAHMRDRRENLRYLPGFAIPAGVDFLDMAEVVGRFDLSVVAVPSASVRSVLTSTLGEHPNLLLATKGLEPISGKLIMEVAREVLPESKIAVISGPNLAVEIVRGIPTAAVVASDDDELADCARIAFGCRSFRVYTSEDVIGIELAGALKNVLAMAAGMSDGLGFGDNTKGALLARGLKEMIALGLAMGAKMETFLGVAGVGDLFATASSNLSRNYRMGKMLASGTALAEAQQKLGQVAEGVSTSEAVIALALRKGIQLPVFEMIDRVVRGSLQPLEAVGRLMERTTREEGIADLTRER